MTATQRKSLDAIDGETGGDMPHYIVCDTCGRIWDIPASFHDPLGCPRCNTNALWRFEDLARAWQHAHDIRGRENT